ncbi:MAG: sugar transferase [Bacteroidota bacterium]|nr:sugar transferase [Bacteroidota bacterium]
MNKNNKILYIGDDDELVKVLSEKFDVEKTENGFLAIDWIDNNGFPIAIISEAFLIGMNGFAFFREFKIRYSEINIPFIIVDGGKDNDSIKKEAFEEGIDDFYIKPINIDYLETRLNYLYKYKEKSSIVSIVENKQKDIKTPRLKRIFDIVFTLFALLFLSPVFLITIIAIRIESKGSIFYSGKRVGAGYNIFPFYKFRSMFVGADAKLKELEHLNQYNAKEKDAEASKDKKEKFDNDCPVCKELGKPCSTILYIGGKEICERHYLKQKKAKTDQSFIKIQSDPRVTKVGRIIRKYSIDELPQLFNVLKGEMSIVGNRPIPLYEAELLTSDDWTERFLAPAGITGLWQISKRGKGNMSDEERKGLDNEYARNFTFWKDIVIIFKTFTAFIQKEDV